MMVSSASELVTTYEERRAGFIALALEKNRRATPFVEQARTLRVSAARAAVPNDLLSFPDLRPALLAASGLSDKSLAHLREDDKTEAVRGLIEQFLEPAGAAFVDELVFRFLLTRGDTLGGSMRNVVGAVAQQKLNRALLAALSLHGQPFQWLHGPSKAWLAGEASDADTERQGRGLSWRQNGEPRTLLYNVTVPLVKNNIDLVLLRLAPDELTPAAIALPTNYAALGELKGGIDPAGADEHWKTARSALLRIRNAFSKHDAVPHTFFVGAAIEKKMASEIWDEWQQAVLSYAANLTDAAQVSALCLWLVSL